MPTALSASEPAAVAGVADLACQRSGLGRAVRVAVTGELDIATVPRLDHELRRAQAEAAQVILDLRGLDFMDYSGLDLILAADRRARRSGGRLVVVRGSAEVEWFFALIGIDRQLQLVDQPPTQIGAPIASTVVEGTQA